MHRISLGTLNNCKSMINLVGKESRPIDDILNEVFALEEKREIVIVGGEPLIHPQILPILHSITKEGVKVIRIVTNGRMCYYPEFCQKLHRFPVELCIECHSECEVSHDTFTGIDKSYSQTVEGIKNCHLYSIPIFGIIDSSNPHHQNIVNHWKTKGISSFVLTTTTENTIKNFENYNYFEFFNDNLPLCFIPSLVVKRITYPREHDSRCHGCTATKICSFPIADVVPLPRKNILETLSVVQNELHKKTLNYFSMNDLLSILQVYKKNEDFWDTVNNLGIPVIYAEHLFSLFKQYDCTNYGLPQDHFLPPMDFSTHRISSEYQSCQLQVEGKDLMKRANYIAECCPSGGTMAFLGDDDFMSLVIASMNVFSHIVVFEIDERIVSTIQSIAKQHHYPITIIHHDLREPFPGQFLHRFDAYYTDSPYTVNGFKLFCSRGIELLKKGVKFQGFQAFTSEFPLLETVELPVQELITEMGLVIAKKHLDGKNTIPQSLHSINIKHIMEKKQSLSTDEEWLIAALGRIEYMFHFYTTGKTKELIQGRFYDLLFDNEGALSSMIDQKRIDTIKKGNPLFNF